MCGIGYAHRRLAKLREEKYEHSSGSSSGVGLEDDQIIRDKALGAARPYQDLH